MLKGLLSRAKAKLTSETSATSSPVALEAPPANSRERARALVMGLQDSICTGLEQFDGGARFEEESWGFAGQHLTNTHAVAVEGFAEETAVGPREIDHFEDAELGRLFRPTAAHRLRLTQPEVDDFARLDVPIKARSNDVEAAGLAAHHPAGFTELTHVAKDQGTDAMAVTQGKQTFGGTDHQAEGPAQLKAGVQAMAERLRPSSSAAVLEPLSQAAVLDNQLSPTLNLNVLFAGLQLEPAEQRRLQEASQELLEGLEEQAKEQGLGDSFFLHLAAHQEQRGHDPTAGVDQLGVLIAKAKRAEGDQHHPVAIPPVPALN